MHVQTVEDLFETEINYYVKVHFNTVIKLVDAIDGIDIYSDLTYSKDGCDYKLGMNHLNGACALRFARERKIYQGGDRHRIKNQQDVIKAVFNKMKNGGALVYNYMDILEAIEGEFLTNLPIDEATSFIKYEMNDVSKYEIYSYQVDGTNAMEYTYTYPNQKLYVMPPKQETVDKAIELLKANQEGKNLKELMEQ
jgi:anionic cell wall polymer biosynthesis LytR-Cps2A-Psr (LCP) family protein